MTNGTITAVEVQETQYGEELVIESPFEAKDYIKVLPWKKLSEEVEEHGSLREKVVSRGMSADAVAIKEAENFGFSDDFAAHASWDPDALGYEQGAWTIDVDAWDEASDFFKAVGFDTEKRASVTV